jgi:hypothetical protein
MRRAAALLLLASCVIAQPRHNGIAVFIDAVPQADGVRRALEKKLVFAGYEIVRRPEEARIGLRLQHRSVVDREVPAGSAGTYLLEVIQGRFPGKRVESLDAACRNLPEPPSECHADTFIRELEDAGVLRSK